MDVVAHAICEIFSRVPNRGTCLDPGSLARVAPALFSKVGIAAVVCAKNDLGTFEAASPLLEAVHDDDELSTVDRVA